MDVSVTGSTRRGAVRSQIAASRRLVSEGLSSRLPSLVLFVSIALILLGFGLVALGSLGEVGDVSGGGVVFIGPIPIAFGVGPQGDVLLLVASILSVGMLAVIYLSFYRRP